MESALSISDAFWGSFVLVICKKNRGTAQDIVTQYQVVLHWFKHASIVIKQLTKLLTATLSCVTLV